MFLFLSDRAYNPANATLTITDTTDGGKVVATGLLSQALVQGLENWVPIALNGNVTTVTGHEYLLTVTDPSVTWTTCDEIRHHEPTTGRVPEPEPDPALSIGQCRLELRASGTGVG